MGERSHLGAEKVDYDTHLKDILNVLEYEDLAKVAGTRRRARLSTWRADLAIEIAPVAHSCDTTARKAKPRSPRDDRGSG